MVKKIIAKDTPLAELTIRKYEKPTMQGRELVRKLCLSLGLLQPGDSRDVIVDILQVLLEHGEELTSFQIEKKVIAKRKENKLPLLGIAPSNIRRQLLRLREIFLIEKVGNHYRVTENATLEETYKEKIESYLLNSITKRILEYLKKADKEFILSKE